MSIRNQISQRWWSMAFVVVVLAISFADGQDFPEARSVGSTTVPIDSWIYPAFDRLGAKGLIHTQFIGLRPWNRFACASLVREAQDSLSSGDAASLEAQIVEKLGLEFNREIEILDEGALKQLQVESIYTRVSGTSGTPLVDGFHFGQTIINDYGRPFGEGLSNVSGFTVAGASGPFFANFRGEYQHGPSVPGYSPHVQSAINLSDVLPAQPSIGRGALDRFTVLDATVGFVVSGWETSVGKQSLWWGPGRGGAMLLSSNAEPMYMARISRSTPAQLPGLLSKLGTIRTEFFFGTLDGHFHPDHPFIHGQKISFKPTENLEVGFARTTVLAGEGRGLTLRKFIRSLTSVGGVNNTAANDPGDRRASIDFSYRLPGVRKWLTLYSDSLSDDDPAPIAAPRRAAFNPGIYLSHIPKVPRLDFRAEAAYTDVPAGRSIGGKFIYWNTIYKDGYTNDRNLIGHWIGREARGLQLFSTYWLSARNTLEFGYRTAHVSTDFIPGGGGLANGSLRANMWWKDNVQLSGGVQVERWKFPLLSLTDQTNVTTSLQITYWPNWRRGRNLPPPDKEGLRWKKIPVGDLKFPKGN